MDPSILLGARGVVLPDPIQQATQAEALAALGDRRRARQLEVEQRARAEQEAAALRDALPGVIKAGFSDEAITAAPPSAQPALLKLQEAYKKNRADTAKTEAETADRSAQTVERKLKLIGGNAFELSNNPNLSMDNVGQFVQQARSLGVDPATLGGMPQDASPEGLRAYMRRIANLSVGAADKIRFAGDEATRAETGRHNLASEANTVRGQDQQSADSAASRGLQRQIAQQNDARQRELTQATRDAAGSTRINTETQALAKFVDSNALPNLITSATALDEVLNGKYRKGDIPGVGMVDSNIPNWLQSGSGKAVRAKIQAVSNDLLKLYSGGAVTLNEAERRAVEMMAAGTFSDQDLRNAWPLVVGRINAAIQNVKGGFSPESIKTYEDRGGIKMQPIGSQHSGVGKSIEVGQGFDSLPDPSTMPGVVIRDGQGRRMRSNGAKWEMLR